MMGEELLKFVSVQKWIVSLEQSSLGRGKGFSVDTKNNRLWHLWKYTDNGKLNPDDLLSEAQTDIEKAMAQLTNHFNSIQKENGVSWNTACTNISFLRGFYTHNDIYFPKRFKTPRRRVSEVSKTDCK